MLVQGGLLAGFWVGSLFVEAWYRVGCRLSGPRARSGSPCLGSGRQGDLATSARRPERPGVEPYFDFGYFGSLIYTDMYIYI